MVTVFGRVRYPDGQLAANTDIHNHIGKTRTDGKVSLRSISIKVSHHYPVSANGSICEADLDLDKAGGLRGWVMLNVHCNRQWRRGNSMKKSANIIIPLLIVGALTPFTAKALTAIILRICQ